MVFLYNDVRVIRILLLELSNLSLQLVIFSLEGIVLLLLRWVSPLVTTGGWEKGIIQISKFLIFLFFCLYRFHLRNF